MKKDLKNPSNKLSMGFGFVRYKYKKDAERALKELQYTSLDGKSLELKRSERTLQYVCLIKNSNINNNNEKLHSIIKIKFLFIYRSDVKTIRKSAKITEQTGTKILVRNLPFQANADEVKDLFK